ncbi:uncharacterized protein LOC143065503 isoform X1 [Mytilus galloprovincialis]|uniref:uncharacterized protein LOC143065503 isoform X1 n=1 Tax=Mytilus galloprovincialis TaxID=29158 RepID=UPI003F7B79CF
MKVIYLLGILLVVCGLNKSEKCVCLHWANDPESTCLEIHFFEGLIKQNFSISTIDISLITIEEKQICRNLKEEDRKLGGSIDITTNPDGSHSYGGSVDTPFGGVSGHVHTSPDGHISGGDAGVSAGLGLGSIGVHGSYDKGKGVSGGVHGSVGVPGAEIGGSVDVNSHGTVTGEGSVTSGGTTFSGSVNSKGETGSSMTQSVPFGKRHVEVDEERVNEESEELKMIISNKNTNDDKSGDVLITILIPQRSRIQQSRITYR